MTVHIVSWFHADSERFHSTYSQTLGSSTAVGHFRIYERCLRVLYGSARRWNPDARLVLVTNQPAESVFEPATIALLERLEVQRLVTPNTHETPPGYWSRWQNQFFVLDVLEAVLQGTEVGSEDAVFVLDSDCIVTAHLRGEVLGPTGLAALPIEMDPDVEENGLTRRQLSALIAAFPDSVPSAVSAPPAHYLGGELVAARGHVLRAVLDRAEAGFVWSLERRAEGLDAANEEAHLLSFAIQSLGLHWAPAIFIARMWTQPWKYRTVERADARRVIWHLPAEKKTGIARLDRSVRAPGWFWEAPAAEWRRRVGAAVSVPRYGPAKLVVDLGQLVAARIRSRSR